MEHQDEPGEQPLPYPGGMVAVGAEYADKATLQYDIGLHCESVGRSVRYPKSDVRWLLARCPNPNCAFEIHARFQNKVGAWKVTKISPHSLDQTCPTPEKKQRVRSSALLKKHNPIPKKPRKPETELEGMGKIWDVVGGDAPVCTWRGWDVEVLSLLKHCSLCYLATSFDNAPELSLMFFKWEPGSFSLVFSTPKDRKYENMVQNGNVAVLLHNYEGTAATSSLLGGLRPLAVTLYGEVNQVEVNGADMIDVDETGETSGSFQYAGAFTGLGKATCRVEIKELLLVNVKGATLRLKRRD